jgi:hypothetical protein
MKTSFRALFSAGLFLLGVAGCNNGNKSMQDLGGGQGDIAMAQSPPDLGCYATPTTSLQILNSCPPSGVQVDQVDKRPTLPLLGAGGTRPPLP